jgi:hypothetical protein
VGRLTTTNPALLERAWALPGARSYHPLRSQRLFSICGPTSAGNVLRSIGSDRGQNPFRRFGLRAMSLDQLARELSEVVPGGWRVEVERPPTVEALRAELRLANEPDHRFIANFSRRPLFGHGGGHHSPLGGWLEREDLAFVLDVNAGYGPWLVSTEHLFEAMATTDRGDGKRRGLVRLRRESRPR